MSTAKKINPDSHVVDILGSTKGRDQPIMLVEKAVQLVGSLSEEVLTDPDTIFFDPFCKAGEILLATALTSCLAKSKRTKPMATIEEISNELYGGRYFALGPDERHYLLSKRTFFGNERSHNDFFTKYIKNGNYVSEVDGRLNEQKFTEELKTMIEFIKKTNQKSKIIAVGNPPYQETDGGAKASAKPVYNFFVEQLMDCGVIDAFALVIPARWFAGGKGLDPFREKIANSGQVKTLHYFERSEDVFPTVHVQGGVCFLHWSKNYEGNTDYIYKDQTHSIDLSRYDIIPDDPYATSIIEKVMGAGIEEFVSEVAWSRKPFGLPTNFFTQQGKEVSEKAAGAIPCMVKGRKTKYVLRSEIKTNADAIDKWKVAIPGAYATGARRCTLPKHQIFLLKKGEIATETYNVIDAFSSKAEAERLIQYLQSDFARYLLGLRKLTQHIPKDRWSWVPYMDSNQEWNDEKLFEYFKLTKKEREHIKKKVQEW